MIIEEHMEYHIGDQVIHLSYGPGIITGIEEKRVADEAGKYYVVQTGELTLWVPLEATKDRIRFPISLKEFRAHLSLLRGPGAELPDFHRDRLGSLAERMKGRSLPEICLVIRDLASRSKDHPLNNNDREVLATAQALLLDEWEIVAEISREAARAELQGLLEKNGPSPQAK